MFNTLRLRQNGGHFADDIFKWIFLNENVWIPIKFSLKFVPQGPINNIPALVQIMAWHRPGDKPLSGPMMVRLPTHICVTRPQWVKMKKALFHIKTVFPGVEIHIIKSIQSFLGLTFVYIRNPLMAEWHLYKEKATLWLPCLLLQKLVNCSKSISQRLFSEIFPQDSQI